MLGTRDMIFVLMVGRNIGLLLVMDGCEASYAIPGTRVMIKYQKDLGDPIS